MIKAQGLDNVNRPIFTNNTINSSGIYFGNKFEEGINVLSREFSRRAPPETVNRTFKHFIKTKWSIEGIILEFNRNLQGYTIKYLDTYILVHASK